MLTVAGVLLLLAPWLPQGLDLTDDGFHLTNQQQLLLHRWTPEDAQARALWLSDVLGAWWLRVCGIGLLQARIGWLVLTAAMAAMSFGILSRFFAPAPTAAAVIASAAVIESQGRLLIDYNHVPGLFLLAACGFLLRSGRGAAFCSGVCIALAAAARLPSLSGMALPWIAAMDSRDWRNALRSNAATIVTLAALSVLTPFDLSFGGVTESAALFGPTHGIISMIGAAALDAAAATILGLLFFRFGIGKPAWLAIVSAAAIPLLLISRSSTLGHYYFIGAIGIVIAALLVEPRRDILILGIAAALAVCIASNSGLWKMRYGLWLALPAAFLILIGRTEPRNRTVAWTAVAAFALLGLAVRFISPYRDGDRLRLTSEAAHPRLRGIFTTNRRATDLQSLLATITPQVHPGDRMMVWGAPMLYFITGTRPWTGDTWPVAAPPAALREQLDRAPLPPLVIRATLPEVPDHTPQTAVLDAWLARNGYASTWSNSSFTILKRR